MASYYEWQLFIIIYLMLTKRFHIVSLIITLVFKCNMDVDFSVTTH